jgi:hypothetical protein
MMVLPQFARSSMPINAAGVGDGDILPSDADCMMKVFV